MADRTAAAAPARAAIPVRRSTGCATIRSVTSAPPYTRGLHEVADGVSAYLQPDGSWGLSNAGLVVDGDASLLVDTLFDLRLTREMLDAMRRATPAAAAIDVVVNTHANGDHCWGNQLVRDAEIVGSRRCAEEMAELPPSLLADVMASPPDGPTGDLLRRMFGRYEFGDIEVVPPTTTFDSELTLTVGDTEVRLAEVGPAHTRGRRDRARPRPRGGVHRRHPVPRCPPDRVGRAGGQLGGGVRPHPRSRPRRGGAGPWRRDRHVGGRRPTRLLRFPRARGGAPGRGRHGARRRRPRHRPRPVRRARPSASGSPPTSPRSTATSATTCRPTPCRCWTRWPRTERAERDGAAPEGAAPSKPDAGGVSRRRAACRAPRAARAARRARVSPRPA